MPTTAGRFVDRGLVDEAAQLQLRNEVTLLLQRMGEGDEGAATDVFAAIYDALRAQARAAMRSQPRNHTLQPTALANEAFLKLVQQDVDWTSRAHFLGVAAKAMRSILVDHAKTKSRRKRKATGRQVQLDGLVIAFEDRSFELLALDEALVRLAARHERAARVVELRFFGGLEFREVAHLIGMPIRTIERDWVFARAWLHAELS